MNSTREKRVIKTWSRSSRRSFRRWSVTRSPCTTARRTCPYSSRKTWSGTSSASSRPRGSSRDHSGQRKELGEVMAETRKSRAHRSARPPQIRSHRPAQVASRRGCDPRQDRARSARAVAIHAASSPPSRSRSFSRAPSPMRKTITTWRRTTSTSRRITVDGGPGGSYTRRWIRARKAARRSSASACRT